MLTPVGMATPQGPASPADGMDRAIARKPRWRRYAAFAALAVGSTPQQVGRFLRKPLW